MRTKKGKAPVLRKSLRQLKSSSHAFNLASQILECKVKEEKDDLDEIPVLEACNGFSTRQDDEDDEDDDNDAFSSVNTAEQIREKEEEEDAEEEEEEEDRVSEEEDRDGIEEGEEEENHSTLITPKIKPEPMVCPTRVSKRIAEKRRARSPKEDSATSEETTKLKASAKVACKICGRHFTKVYMSVHLRSHTSEKPYDCPKCKKVFASQNYLRVHTQMCYGKNDLFKCHVCDRNLVCKGRLTQHLRTHSEERPFKCKICGKAFKQSSVLCNHVKIHDMIPRYQCELCGNQYRSIQGLNRHRERIHEGIRHSFPCDICGKSFTRRTKLKDHKMWHDGTSPYICNYCGKRLLSRKTLKTHLLIHENKKPYVCNVCGKAFRQNCVLKRHITVHTGIKPFRCELCGKQFIHRTYLMNHKCPLELESDSISKLVVTAATATTTATTTPSEETIVR